MKNMKKLFALVLALALCFSLALPALAADDPTAATYTINLKAPLTGHQYGAFQIFDGDLHNGILSNVTWGTGIDITKETELLNALGAMNLVTYDKDGKAKDAAAIFANAKSASDVASIIADAYWTNNDANLKAVAAVLGNYLSTTYAVSAKETAAGDDLNYIYTISGLDAGYYLIKDVKTIDSSVTDSFYTDYILHVVRDITVSAKGNTPEVDKTVYNSSQGYYAEYADTYIGSVKQYKVVATIPSYYAEYEKYGFYMQDEFSAGLDYVGLNKVYMIREGDVIVDVTHLKDSMWFETYDETTKTLKIDFPEVKYESKGVQKTFVGKDAAGEDITVTVRYTDKFVAEYTAQLNKNAIIGSAGNPNKATLFYKNNPNDGSSYGKTPPDQPKVYSFGIQLNKVDADANTVKLAGAEFVLWLYINTVPNYAKFDANGKFDGWTTKQDEATILVTDAQGQFTVKGLDEGGYRLTETKAPAGYNKLTHDVLVDINAHYDENTGNMTSLTYEVNGESASGNMSTGIVVVTVENNSGATLPSTGGTGTTMFYIIGGVLVAAAAVLLIAKKRMAKEQ